MSKVSDDCVPLLEELRPLTLLNSDYKLLTKILSRRILKVLPSVILSVQSSCLPGNNICAAAFNLISVTQAIEKTNGKAAIVSLDFMKAYDRVNLFFLEKVMKSMHFSDTFIQWIKLLHRGAPVGANV